MATLSDSDGEGGGMEAKSHFNTSSDLIYLILVPSESGHEMAISKRKQTRLAHSGCVLVKVNSKLLAISLYIYRTKHQMYCSKFD